MTNKTTLDFIKEENVLEAVLSLVHPQQNFTGGSYPYSIEDYQGDAVDYKNFLISIPIWAKNILDTDDFSKEISGKLLQWQNETSEHFWDYNIEDFLSENGYFEDCALVHSDYTYNNPDHCRLDRDIHYTVFKYDYEYYVCFSIHYGADARAGFSDSIVLRVRNFDYFFMAMEISAYEENTSTDYEWYEIENVATYNEETREWVHNETGEELNIHSSANGY